jgi:hypothetical protein
MIYGKTARDNAPQHFENPRTNLRYCAPPTGKSAIRQTRKSALLVKRFG